MLKFNHIEELIGEATEYEKKQAAELKKPKSWCKSASAFANTSGGTLIFGIADDDSVVGLSDAEHDAEAVSEIMKNRLSPVPEFKLSFHVTKNGKKLLLLHIFKGGRDAVLLLRGWDNRSLYSNRQRKRPGGFDRFEAVGAQRAECKL